MSKRFWPLDEKLRLALSSSISDLDRARKKFEDIVAKNRQAREKRLSELEEMSDEESNAFDDVEIEAGNELVKQHAATGKVASRLSDHRMYDTEKGFAELGAPAICLTDSDDEDKLPRVWAVADEWLSEDFYDSDELLVENQEDEMKELEHLVRHAAKTGWPGLSKRERQAVTRIRDQARTLLTSLDEWLK